MKNGRPSNTAKLIARCTLLASKDPQLSKLIPPDAIEPLQRVLAGDLFCKGLKFAPCRSLLRMGERLLLPGIIAHYLTRKTYIEQEVVKAIAEGCRRVVVIGAGYDTMAWRLHREHPDVEFLEIDHPATQKIKRERLDFQNHLSFEALDLNHHLPALEQKSCGTVFIIEGVTMYLTEAQVTALLRSVALQAGSRGKVIWTFMEKDEANEFGFRGQSSLIPKWLKFCREPFRWGLARDSINAFASSCHLQPDKVADHQLMRDRILSPLNLQCRPLAQGELICTSTPQPA